MANRDHSLDDGIIQAAYSEFLAYGFQKASLHKIAEKAGVTTGAIYTRYKNKDALFASLLQDFFETMQVLFAPIAEEYEKAKKEAITEENYKEADYYQRQIENLHKEKVIDSLSKYCVIPKYGFPVDVVELQIYKEGIMDNSYDLSRDLKIAI